MRIADSMMFDQVTDNIGKNRSELADLQNKAATQKRVVRPSDDPVAATRVLKSRTELQEQTQYSKNLNYAKSFLDFTDQSLDELTGQLVRAKELAVAQANDASSNNMSRRVMATEVKQISNQMALIGNRKLGDRYIFTGYKTTAAPFSQGGDYKGDSGEILIGVEKGSFLAMNLPGSKVFLGEGLSGDGVSSSTTEQSKDIEELIANDKRDKAKLQRDRETAPDMRGPASIAKAPKTMSIQKVNANGQVVQGQTEEVPDSGGGINLFRALKNFEISLITNDKSGIQDSISVIDDALQQVILARSQVGSRVMSLNSTMETLSNSKINHETAISQLEDVDVYKVISDINKNESTLKATLATSGRLIQPSLMDFLR